MREITKQLLKKETLFLYIHTPFCGTCHVARSMLEKIESIHKQHIFYEMNASFYPQFMQDEKITSVPCLYIKVNNVVKEKIYAFQSIGNIYSYLHLYQPELFQ